MAGGRALVEKLLRRAAKDDGTRVTAVEWTPESVLVFSINGAPRELMLTSRELENCDRSSEVRTAVVERLKRLVRSGRPRKIGF